MGPLTYLAVFVMIWWITLFMILPLAKRKSHHEEGIKLTDGSDPGSPVKLDLMKSIKLNTIVALVVWVMFIIVYNMHWVEF